MWVTLSLGVGPIRMIAAFDAALASPSLPEHMRDKMRKCAENARHRLKTGKDLYEAADCVIS